MYPQRNRPGARESPGSRSAVPRHWYQYRRRTRLRNVVAAANVSLAARAWRAGLKRCPLDRYWASAPDSVSHTSPRGNVLRKKRRFVVLWRLTSW